MERYLETREGEKPLGVYALYDAAQTLQYVGYARNMPLAIKVPPGLLDMRGRCTPPDAMLLALRQARLQAGERCSMGSVVLLVRDWQACPWPKGWMLLLPAHVWAVLRAVFCLMLCAWNRPTLGRGTHRRTWGGLACMLIVYVQQTPDLQTLAPTLGRGVCTGGLGAGWRAPQAVYQCVFITLRGGPHLVAGEFPGA